MPTTIRPATPGDEPLVLHFVRELARYEKLERQLDLDVDRLRHWLFEGGGNGGALIAESERVPVGFALFFATFSTFKIRPCLWLEDLFVLPEHRGRGHGLALLRAVAKEAVRRGAPRLDWAVLDWNELAIGFYERQGARLLDDWRVCRLDEDALAEFAGGDG